MKIEDSIIQSIKSGAVGVIPTDTVYGLIASIAFPGATEKIYALKQRPCDQGCIVLVRDISDLSNLGVHVSPEMSDILLTLWQDPISVILPTSLSSAYADNITKTVAVRLPRLTWLRELMQETGPIVATSANISGSPTPSKIEEIKDQLPDLDFYVEGPVTSAPSKLARLHGDGTIEWLSR